MADEGSSYPVWVGNLAPRITESVLLDLFGKFGPVKNVSILRDENGASRHCGFVSFCSYSVSQAAATCLDGCDVFGQIIETRGPDKLAIRSYAPKAVKGENSDGKVLLDCVQFVEKRNCPFKNGQCPYRHCEDTQHTDKVCEKWLKYQCRNVNCPERHPVINILKEKIDVYDKSKSKTQTARCPSHNAYKCTGECGDADCETHFMDVDDMAEHLNKANNPIPIGACSGCKAVFFSEEERKKHSCFQPKHHQTPFIPIYHPVKQTNKCTCDGNGGNGGPLTMCKSCGCCYEHSGDTLSTFDSSPKKKIHTGHKCPNSPSVRNSDGIELEPIGVFWDIENCPVPRGKSAVDIVQKIREEFFTNKREAEFMCVCDISKEKKEIIEDLNKSQVTVVHINATSKNAADDKLRQSLRRFAQSYPPPATVILVSGDINFAAELSDLRHRHKLTVICLHNAQTQSALLACAHESKRFDLFTDDLPVTTIQMKTSEENGSQHVELTIGNLPIGKDVAQIKSRLKKLSENCGGKVSTITGRRAVMKFPNYHSAVRAKKRMENEDVYGSLIQVAFPPSNPNRLSPTKSAKVTKPIKMEDTMDMISKGPQRVSSIVPTTKKEPRIVSMLKKCGDQLDEIRDEALEEFVCVPSQIHSLQPEKPLPYHNQAAYMTSTYSTTYQNPYSQGVIPLPPQGVACPIPYMGQHPLAVTWLANLHSLSMLEQQKGGVDIVVSNLDEAVGRKELKKKLASVFREHCKVYSVMLHSGDCIPLLAFIKVPKLSDAQLAMSKVNNQRIFSTNVTVTLATEKEKELYLLTNEVTSILKDAPLHWMPLNKFLSVFYEKSLHQFDMNILTMLTDVVSVIGKPGCEAICMATPNLHTVKIQISDFDAFARDVHLLLKQYQGSLLLANFAALYWLKFDTRLEVHDKGVCLSNALKDVVNVCIRTESGKDVVCWVKEGIVGGGIFNKLEEFSKELQDLLKAQPQFKLPLSQLISSYQKWFRKKSPFDPVNYGFSSVKDLLEALPSLVQVKEEGVDRYVVLEHKYRLKAFAVDLATLLESQPDYQIPLNQLMATYQRTFGYKCLLADYGVDNATVLIDKLPSHQIKVSFNGKEKIIALTDSEKTQRMLDRVAKETLTHEVQQLFINEKQMAVDVVAEHYNKKYGHHLDISKAGFRSLESLLVQVIPGVKIIDVKGERIVSLPTKDTQSTRELIELIALQDGCFTPLKRLPILYRKHFNKKFPLTMDKLRDVIDSTDKELRILGADNDQILCYTNISKQGYQSPPFKKLVRYIHDMLIKFPGCRMLRAALADIYHQQRGVTSVLRKWPELSNLDSLLKAMSDSIEVTGTGDFASVCLKHEYVIRCLANQVVTVLSSYIGKTVPISNLPKLYEKTYGQPLRTHHYGFVSVGDMLNAMCSVVKVTGGSKKKVCLSPLQLFAVEAKQLLTHQGGCVSLNRFAPCYQQYYNKPCKASDYGFSRLSEVIAAVPNIAEVRGKGVDKMVVLVSDGDVLLETIAGERPSSTTSDHSRTDSPPVIYEGSDTESVIVEEEIVETEEVFLEGSKTKDLIVLSSNDDHSPVEKPSDWMMAPVPNTLPEPGLYPQQQPAKPQKPHNTGDLISFKEFDVDKSLVGLRKNKYPMEGDEFSNEDMEVLIANQNATSSPFGAVKQSSVPSNCPRSHTSPAHLPLSPGMHDLSDVEAEILKLPKQNSQKNSNSSASKSARKSKPQLALSIYKDYTPTKKVTPVKLAMNFSSTK